MIEQSLASIRVAVLDRSEISRLATRLQLQNSDIEIIAESDNGTKAIEIVKKIRPDVVLMELSLLELDGIQTTQAIKKFSPDVKVVVLTPWKADLERSLKAGADGFVCMENWEQLPDAIRTVSAGGRWIGSKH